MWNEFVKYYIFRIILRDLFPVISLPVTERRLHRLAKSPKQLFSIVFYLRYAARSIPDSTSKFISIGARLGGGRTRGRRDVLG